MALRVYLDMCAWKRPYDRVSSERVRIEALAVVGLLEAAAGGTIDVVSSAVLEAENARNPDLFRRTEVALLLGALPTVQSLDDGLVARARVLEALGMRPLDALHAASAEAAGCDYLITTDERMAGAMARHAGALRTRGCGPTELLRIIEAAT